MAQIQHPGVIKVHKVDRVEAGQYLLEEYVEGENLDEVLERGPPPFDQTTQIMRDLADAVEAVHRHGILHRDIKPANVILRADTGRPMLLDFGLAREVDAETLSKTGQLLGTPAYMSPEQARGTSSKALTPGVDVYGLGCLLYALLTGDAPFSGGNMFALLRMIMAKEPSWPHALNPDVPEGLDAICRRAMAKDPADRYPTAAAMRDALDPLLRGEEPSAKPIKRRLGGAAALAAAVALTALTALAAAAVGTLSTSPEVQPPPKRTPPPRERRLAPEPTPTSLWTLAPGDTFTIVWHYQEDDGQRFFELRAEMPTRVTGHHEREPASLVLETTIEWASARLGFQQGGMAMPYDTRDPPSTAHPLKNLDVAIGRPFTFMLRPDTGHVTDVSGLTAIYADMERVGFAGSGVIDPSETDRIASEFLSNQLLVNSIRLFFSRAFENNFLRQCFDAVLHTGGGACDAEVVNWVPGAQSPNKQPFLVRDDEARACVYPVSVHFLGETAVTRESRHTFRLRGAAAYSGGRLVKSSVKQELLFPKPGPGLGDTIELTLSLKAD